MARSKIKIGDKVKFNFAGSPHVGILESIDKTTWGTVETTWYRVKSKDGTIYPCRKGALTLADG